MEAGSKVVRERAQAAGGRGGAGARGSRGQAQANGGAGAAKDGSEKRSASAKGEKAKPAPMEAEAEGGLKISVGRKGRSVVSVEREANAGAQWQYQDPEGNTHGPFAASALLGWFDKGFFSGNLPGSTSCRMR